MYVYYTVGRAEIKSHSRKRKLWTLSTVKYFNYFSVSLNSDVCVVEAAKIGFPSDGENDLLIANPVKDWLKYAKTRLNRQKV